jgi:hypothetical protein
VVLIGVPNAWRMTHKLTVAALLLVTSGTVNAVEKYWIVHEASLIVVGTLHSYPVFPWFDGWHLNGTIEVDEVVFGTKPPGPITYRSSQKYPQSPMSIDWRSLFSGRPDFLKEKGMWFLRPIDGRTWQPSVGLGYVDLPHRADYEAHIRR